MSDAAATPPPFDPLKPFTPVGGAPPPFDPTKPFTPAGAAAPTPMPGPKVPSDGGASNVLGALLEAPFNAMDAAKAVGAPIVNFLDYPVRAAAADIVGAVKGGIPKDDKSREAFYREREKSLEQTKIHETPTGEAISSVLSAPGQLIGAGVKKLSESVMGLEATKALGPIATVAGDVAPGVMGALKGRAAPKTISVRPEAKSAIEAGYRFPAGEIPPLGEKPPLVARALSSESGKIKTQQAASTRNQINTNSIAARDIGLPPGTPLTEQAFETALQPAKQAYADMVAAVPEVTLSDGSFRSAAETIGGKDSLVEKFFPGMKANPGIEQLRSDMLANKSIPSSVALKAISDLRHDAGTNLKAIGDAQRHALGIAQREAATLLEDAFEKSIAFGPDTVKAFAEHETAKEATAAAKATVDGIEARNAKAGLPKTAGTAQAKADLLVAEMQAKVAFDEVNKQIAARTPADVAKAHADLEKFRQGRTLFAKVYNVRDATNLTTGNVSAAGLARVYNKNAPLTGGLKTIADAYNTAPKAMQVPELFGHAEEWSVLDFFGTAGALASGHPAVAAGIIGRPSARAVVLSDRYQKRMVTPPTSSPSRTMGLGEGLQPHDDTTNIFAPRQH